MPIMLSILGEGIQRAHTPDFCLSVCLSLPVQHQTHYRCRVLAADGTVRVQQWVTLWTQLLKDVISDGVTGNRVIVDILNEPDAAKFR